MPVYIGNKKVGINNKIVKNEGIPRAISSGIYNKPNANFKFKLPDGATTVGEYALTYAFNICNTLQEVDLNNVTSISQHGLQWAFGNCHNLSTVKMNNLTTVSGENGMDSAFCNTPITNLNLSSLTTVSGANGLTSVARSCSSLINVDLSNLSTITGSYALQYAFQDCTSLTSLSFPSLNSNSFGTKTNQFFYMLFNVSDCTVHFPSNLESVIGSWSDVVSGFGGTNTTVLFDLTATT